MNTDNNHKNSRLSPEQMASVFRKAVKDKLIIGDDTAIIFYDLSLIESNIKKLNEQTADIPSIHTSAVKANPLIAILSLMADMDFGAETASLPELYMALKAGFPPDKIVFDSPAKTIAELEYAISKGVHINADSFEELERIESIIRVDDVKSTFGLRVNPQVGTGDIAITSVAAKHSKFGVPLDLYSDKIIKAYCKYGWLAGIHVHIGSQGMPLNKLVEGVSRVYGMAEKINMLLEKEKLPNRIKVIDIGGGLPVIYLEQKPMPSIEDYFTQLKKRIPGLFSGKYKIITEFGRYIHANAGWAISRVEYIKNCDNIKYAVIHLGADMFIRECYNGENWPHEYTVLNPEGEIKAGNHHEYMIAGPLCFAGDIIAKNVMLPSLESGDFIIIRDTGAYTVSMWSRYNSRQKPKIIGYYNNGEKFNTLKNRETPEDVYNYWK